MSASRRTSGRPRLHVIGSSPAWPNPGEPCSSYLVEAGGARVLVDCGSGALAELLRLDPEPVDAVVITHLHFDHVADLIPFAYHLQLGVLSAWPTPALHVPPGGREALARLAVAGGAKEDHLDTVFQVGEYDPHAGVGVREARVAFAAMNHPGICHAVRIEADGGAFCFSADTGPVDTLAELARGADLFLCEAAAADEEGPSTVHLRGEDAGAIARDAGVGRLILTHVEAHRRPPAQAAARVAFGGPVDLAVPGFRAEA